MPHLWLKLAAGKNIQLSQHQNIAPLYIRVGGDKLSASLKFKIGHGSILWLQAAVQMTELCMGQVLDKCTFFILTWEQITCGLQKTCFTGDILNAGKAQV